MRKYIDPEYYCDVCGRQVKTKHDLYKVNVEHGGLGQCRIWNPAYDPIDVCWECRKEIVDFIKGMMKQKEDAKRKGKG